MTKAKYDFSTQLHHMRKGRPFSGASLGFPVELFQSEHEWQQPLRIGAVLELALLYGKLDGLSQKDKREFFATALKVRDCDVAELTPDNIDAARRAASIFGVEPYGMIDQFFDSPIADESSNE